MSRAGTVRDALWQDVLADNRHRSRPLDQWDVLLVYPPRQLRSWVVSALILRVLPGARGRVGRRDGLSMTFRASGGARLFIGELPVRSFTP